MKRALLLAIGLATFVAAPGRAFAWNPFESKNDEVERGNAALGAGDAKTALESYDRAARKLPNEPGVQLGRGLALMALGENDRAREAFLRAAEPPAPASLRADAHHNLGLSFYRQADAAAANENHGEAQRLFREAADAFRRSLRARPGNRDAAWNLELAKRRLREEQEAEKQEGPPKDPSADAPSNDDRERENENESSGDGNEDAENRSETEPEGSDEGDSKEPKEKPSPEEKGEDERNDAGRPNDADGAERPTTPPPSPPGRSEEVPSEVSRVLDALERSEDSFQKHRGRVRARQENRRPIKDW